MAQAHDQTKNCTPVPSHTSLELGGHPEGTSSSSSWAWACVAVCLAVLGLAGAGILVWWAMAFHQTDEQLWMVPVSLVLLGTPLVAWLSIFASGACRRLNRLRDVPSEPPPSPLAVAVVPER